MGITEPRATDLPPPPPPPPRPTYLLSRWLFLRLLGVIYFIAFVSLALQITGLVGEHGILPARTFLERAHALYGGAAYRLFPTLCWLVGGGDGMLRALCWGGAVLALLVVAGVAQAPALALLWLLYLSTSVVGQTFLWFQWDALLLEAGLLAVFYAPTDLVPSRRRERAPSEPMRWVVLWLLFRLMFLSGITKLASGDPTWRDLTALDYHFWTQPLPPGPVWKRRAVRVLVPVVAVLSLLAFVREIVQTLPGARGRAPFENPLLDAVAPFRSINGYGLFRVMTTERPEIVVEGSRDTMAWREYRFRWKPGDVTRRPRFVAPHQPRLDWQMWFAALDPDGARGWLDRKSVG